ncbi:MAG: hypothetical protein CMP10_00390 [Zetaproteobacteria bacterium]|nr:hypothetical protein [Pseudobdellovibrionaceae bacterium]
MAGRLNLAVTGIQDQWLTGKPEFSYFLMNFKRHTKFSIEAIETPFDGDVDFDTTLECRIPSNKGDLIRSMMLKFTLPQPTGTPGSGKDLRYIKSIGSKIIQHADLLIGGQTIERITGDYIYMYDQLHNNKDDLDQTLYFLGGHDNYIAVSSDWDYNVFLPFYFFRHPSLAIPVFALTKQQVEIRIKFKKLKDITVSYTTATGAIADPPSDVVSSIKKPSLITDFFFITEYERDFIMTRPIEYIITQVQMSKFKMKAGESKKSIMLKFKGPVKEMLFMAVSDDVYKYNPIKHVSMKFNNNTIIDADNLMLSYEQPLKYYTGVTNNNFGVYSFSLKPETYYPTGQVNMSRIAHNLLEVELDEPDATFEHTVYVYGVSYNVLRVHSGLGGLKF